MANTNAHLIEWNFSHSCFTILGSFNSVKAACDRRMECRQHFNYQGNDLEVISDYELGRLEALA